MFIVSSLLLLYSKIPNGNFLGNFSCQLEENLNRKYELYLEIFLNFFSENKVFYQRKKKTRTKKPSKIVPEYGKCHIIIILMIISIAIFSITIEKFETILIPDSS